MAKLTWQRLESDDSHIVAYRARVRGGWLVSIWAATALANAKGKPLPDGSNLGGGLTFVPDRAGRWNPELAKKGSP